MRRRDFARICLAAAPPAFAAGTRERNEEAVREVADGRRTTASAAWWGYHPEDATAAVQAAIDSKAKTVVIPYVGGPWTVRPIKLRSDLELIFEPGVLVLAKANEFHGGNDCLFAAVEASNLTIRGYGATLRMRKADYQKPPYKKAEWRMTMSFTACRNVLVEGVRVESSGGDGFYVAGNRTLRWSENVTIRSCVAHDHHRQGISVISAVNLLVENCTFSGTSGTAPEAGIDVEPDMAEERIVNCVVRNCLFENNAGHAMMAHLRELSSASAPVSLRFENCHARMGRPGMVPADFRDVDQRGWAGMSVGAVRDDGPTGVVEFVDCTSENTGKEGARINVKSADKVRVRFVRCSWRNPWVSAHPGAYETRVPILFRMPAPVTTKRMGGVDFDDCYLYDTVNRPVVAFDEEKSSYGLFDVHGQITVRGTGDPWMRLGPKVENVDLKLVKAAAER
jgi:hypothetical protein